LGANRSIKRILSTSFSCFTKLRTYSKVTAVFDAIILPYIFFPASHNFMSIARSSIRVHQQLKKHHHSAKSSLTLSGNKRTAALCPIVLLCSIKPGISAIGKNGKARLLSLCS
jgi:hypothetical protein